VFFFVSGAESALFVPSGERYFHLAISSGKNEHNRVHRLCVLLDTGSLETLYVTAEYVRQVDIGSKGIYHVHSVVNLISSE
jgi:hypothetical protein